MTTAWYLSHPQVAIDPAVPVPSWGLSETGRARMEALGGRAWLASIRRIVSSDEAKAVEAAGIAARLSGASVEVLPGFHKNDRSATGFLPPAEFEAVADRFFAEPDRSVRGWERAIDAQARIVQAVEYVLANHPADQPILFVGHGGVGTLLKCHIKGDPIARSFDQAAEGGDAGGGNVHAFTLAERRHLLGWAAMETVQ